MMTSVHTATYVVKCGTAFSNIVAGRATAKLKQFISRTLNTLSTDKLTAVTIYRMKVEAAAEVAGTPSAMCLSMRS